MSWPLVPLEKIALINPRFPKGEDENQKVTFLAMSAISEEGTVIGGEKRTLKETKKGFTYFEQCDVLLAKITPCFENGKAALLKDLPTKIGFGSTEFHVIRANEKLVLPEYLFYMVWNKEFRFLGERNMTGSAGQKRVPSKYLNQLEIPLPPLQVQKQIAAVLEKADTLSSQCQQMEQELNSLAQSLFLDMFGDPVSNPKGWKTSFLSNHGNFKNGLNFSKGESGVSVKYLGVGDFKSLDSISRLDQLGAIELSKLPIQDYFLEKGDIVFVRSNGNKALVGRCLTIYPDEKVTYSGFCIRYRIQDTGILPEYLNYLFKSNSMKESLLQGGQGANIQNINQKILSSIPVPLPPLEQQQIFVKALELLRVQRKASRVQSEDLESLFNSLMQRAFKGELALKDIA